MDMEQGAMVEPVACAVQMTKVGNVRANQTIVVLAAALLAFYAKRSRKFMVQKKPLE
jgi:D-xylulose reductase